MVFSGNIVHEYQFRPPTFDKTTDPDIVLGISLGPDVTIVSDGSADHLYWHGTHGSVALGYQHGSRWLLRPLALAQPSIVSGATNVNTV